MTNLAVSSTPSNHGLVPRPAQVAAVNNLADQLRREGRATCVSAPGTGKTLVQLLLAERVGGLVVVATPTIWLTHQTYRVWHENGSPAARFVMACSESPDVEQEMPLAAVSTTPSEIAAGIVEARDSDQMTVVFSTHRSLPMVELALLQLDRTADLLLVDEAHRVAGDRSDGRDAAIGGLPARSRCFFTATPRVSGLDAWGHHSVEISMDDPTTFGPWISMTSFHEAITATPPLLADYRVVGVGVPSSAAASRPALHVAVAKAAAEWDAQRLLTFHPNVDDAEDWAATHPQIAAGTVDEATACWATSSRDPVEQRAQAIESYLAHPGRAMMSNCRILGEGVDFPAVDMIVFTTPKQSVVEIVQAVGRALRLDPERPDKIATIVVPVFIQGHGSGGELNVDLDPMVTTILAMRDLDSGLAGSVDQAVRHRGEGDPFAEGLFLVDLPPGVDSSQIEPVLIARAATDGRWFARLAEAATFAAEHNAWPSPPSPAGEWVAHQRRAFVTGTLTPERQQALDEAGFVFNPRDLQWEAGFAEATAQHLETGKWPNSHWVIEQRSAFRRGRLRPDRMERLTQAGFVWNARDHSWAETIAEVAAYKNENGEFPIRGELAKWISRNRRRAWKGALEPDRRQAMEALGIDLRTHDERWDDLLHQAILHREENGHWPQSRSPLGRWVIKQRALARKGELPKARLAKAAAAAIINPHTPGLD